MLAFNSHAPLHEPVSDPASKINDRLETRYLKPLPAARILALHQIIAPDHVRLPLAESQAILFRRPSAKSLFLCAHHPAYLVGLALPAMQTGKLSGLDRFLLVEEIAFFHKPTILT